MKTAIETQWFVNTASQAGVSEEERQSMVLAISAEPDSGDIIAGTGGCRKRRFAGRGKGKSGGYRTVHFNGADDVPVLLLVVIDKGERANLSPAERNELKKSMETYEREYRAGQAAKVKQLKEGA